MPSIPWDSMVLLFLVDTLLAMGVSAFVGCLLAFAIDRPVRNGVLIGAALPFVGPLVWAVRARRAGSFGGGPDATLDGRLRWVLGVALAIPGLAYLIAVGLPWAGAEGNVKGYAAFREASLADTVVGAAVLGLCAVALLGCAINLIWASRWRTSALAVAVSGLWLALTIDTLIIFSATNRLAANVEGLSGGIAEAHVSAGSGTWTVLAASMVGLTAGLALGVAVSRSTASEPVVAADLSMISTGFDYGDGF